MAKSWDRVLDHEHRLIEKMLEILQKEAEKQKRAAGAAGRHAGHAPH